MSKTIEEVMALLDEFFGASCEVDYNDFEQFAARNRLQFASGETRFCLFDPSWNEVLKIARFDNVDDDYNEIEFENYLIAKKMGIERILLPIRVAGSLECGISVYAQTRYSYSQCNTPRDKRTKLRKQVKNLDKGKIFLRSYQHCYDSQKISDLWYKRAYQIYGKKFMRKFEEFTNNQCINDLHSNNVGYLGKMPIILDFAGYHE